MAHHHFVRYTGSKKLIFEILGTKNTCVFLILGLKS